MTLHLYDSLSRSLRPFYPVNNSHVSIYVCGATVQSIPHIGHMRSGVAFDILRRWLMHQGYDVWFIRNVTDIDDKILTKAREAQRPWWEWATTHERAFNDAYRALGVLPPSAEPHATGYIPQIISYIERLINAGHAYAADSDVYFSVQSFARYGELSGQKIADMQQGETPTRGKKDPHDFTLWKNSKPGEPFWDSPWGKGRPGWHIECSAMATSLLGSTFDIHGGGIDLAFPHHENEIAQSQAAGDPFAQYWLHNGWITMSGEKMSKSLGNVVSIPELLKKVRGIELRYYMSLTHYRSHQEFSFHALADAVTAFNRIENFLTQAHELCGDIPVGQPTEPFIAAMNKDIHVPEAIAEIHAITTEANTALTTTPLDTAHISLLASQVRSMLAILGCDPLDPTWATTHNHDTSHQALQHLVTYLLDQRTHARETKNYATADELRTVLQQAGIDIHDGNHNSRWSLTPQRNL